MKLLITGLNHRTAPVEVRERLAFEERALPQALDDLKRQPGLLEGMILSTCNRVEVTVTADEHAVAKRVRSETDIGQSAVSVSYAAVELAREIFGSLGGKRALLVGAGKMAESAARHLRRAGVSEILVANRTRSRSESIAEEFQGRIVDYDRFSAALKDVDIVLASSGAPHYILTRDQMRDVIGRRRNRPMFLIDIAVPRNIEPAVNELDNVFLYDIDDLDKVVQ